MIEYPVDRSVTTLYELLQRAGRISNNGEFIGERINDSISSKRYSWIRYDDAIERAQRIGSALIAIGLNAGEQTRVGICGLNCAEYMLATYACMAYSIVIVPLYHNYKHDAHWYVHIIDKN